VSLLFIDSNAVILLEDHNRSVYTLPYPQREGNMDEPDRNITEDQVALTLAALSVAFARVLQELELLPHDEPLVILQRAVQVEQTRLRQTPGAETAVAMFRFVIDALRNPDVIGQPED
jgi:hypothetical protein